MKTGAEGVNVLLGWYNNGVKWLKGQWTPESRVFSQKKEQKVPKKKEMGKIRIKGV